MGHSWREMDPKGAEEHDKRIERSNRAWEGVKNIPLSFFTVGEYLSLNRFIEDAASDTDMKVVEKIIAKFKKLNPVFCKYCKKSIGNDPDHRC